MVCGAFYLFSKPTGSFFFVFVQYRVILREKLKYSSSFCCSSSSASSSYSFSPPFVLFRHVLLQCHLFCATVSLFQIETSDSCSPSALCLLLLVQPLLPRLLHAFGKR